MGAGRALSSWQAELTGGTDRSITDLLTIRLLWEEALFARYKDLLGDKWALVKTAHAQPMITDHDLTINAILQEAWEHAVPRDLAATFAAPATSPLQVRPAVQAAFCILRSVPPCARGGEPRHPDARLCGLFGLTALHKGFASDVAELRLPVLLNPGVTSTSEGENVSAAQTARFKSRAHRAWGRFKLAAVSSFAFVEATGPVYAGKLVKDSLNIAHRPATNSPVPRFDPPLPLAAEIEAAETILRAMSLTTDFSRMVVLTAHGANVVNTPFASGQQAKASRGGRSCMIMITTKTRVWACWN